MARPIKSREVEEEVVESEAVHLYRITFSRPPKERELSGRIKAFITFGTSEEDAVERIWTAYQGSSFTKEFNREVVKIDFILGDILKIGG